MMNGEHNDGQVSDTYLDNIIKQLEISDGSQATSCVRSVFVRNDAGTFLRKLDERVKYYDNEIEKLCNFQYQGFVKAFHELLQVRKDTTSMKNELVKNNQMMQQAGQSLAKKTESLIKEYHRQGNIQQTIDALAQAFPVFETYRKLQDCMEEKKLYPALKLLEQLETKHLALVKEHRWSELIQNNIAKFRNQIRNESHNELKNFLENVATHADKIGKSAFAQAAARLDIDRRYYTLEEDRRRDQQQQVDGSADLALINMNITELIDFSPIYKSLHINLFLNCKEEFSKHYQREKQKQAPVIMDVPPKMHESFDAFKKYLQRVTGFFIVEDHVMNTTEGLIDQRFYYELSERATQQLLAVLRRAVSTSYNPDLMLDMKIVVVLFCAAIKESGFPVTPLLDVLMELRESYQQLLLNQWSIKFKEILRKDNYIQMVIEDETQYQLLLRQFPLRIEATERLPFPRSLPYSESVPKIFLEIKEFAAVCAKFAKGLNVSKTEIDDMIRKPSNLLLTKTLKSDLVELTAAESETQLNFSQLVQICINTIHLENAMPYLEDYIVALVHGSTKQLGLRLQGASMLKDIRSLVEDRIHDKLNDKIDQCLDIASYDWMMQESMGVASDYITTTIKFLENTFRAFTHLPTQLSQTTCLLACKHISTSLIDKILSAEVKAISLGALEQMSLDLMQCEVFASKVNIANLDSETLLLCFQDLRQLFDLIMDKQWSVYFERYGDPDSPFGRVNPHTVLTVVEKLREGLKRPLLLKFNRPALEKENIKLFETVSKDLRSLIIDTS
ncbi:unnamed protein product [Rotaria socialis]|uniref:Exocyst complex component n=1 Tax=Rotaria socialis TaxID=392032 RepID=A0A819VRH6_9BILA|nr:unnamed protein product [Rotaria socialis]CAF3317787.1 unnamed protein product [Rotaria socialis]CAF3552097.1 unnamed protein product [Rotaria socialis]CAF3672449.1 unnamed protein product [Rotaria socialis]CAF3769220.1 unnamed protein product [Rotaria socialis]